MQGNREDNNDKINILKKIFYSISTIILICFAIALLVSIIKDSKKADLQTDETELTVYYVENIEDLHIGEEFDLANYYIKNKNSGQCYYHIDEKNILWGCGTNSSGVLGDIEKNEVEELVEIAKNVIHVDCREDDFMIFLTANGKHKIGCSQEEIFKVANSRLGWYRRCGMSVVNFIISKDLLENRIKDGAGLLNPLSYYLVKVGI